MDQLEIFIVGEQVRRDELRKRLGEDHTITESETVAETRYATEGLDQFDVIFDLNLDDHPDNIKYYSFLEGKTILGCTVKKNLGSFYSAEMRCNLIGLNALPTFLDRETLEVCFANAESKSALDEITAKLGLSYLEVKDAVGMVSPRVICMIINEAAYTLEEGTANKEDIDLGMKLGMNYPKGPLEWADQIGIKNVYETLNALYQQGQEERYSICPLLESKFKDQQGFYN